MIDNVAQDVGREPGSSDALEDLSAEDEQDLLAQLAEAETVEERVEILAVMQRRGFRPPTRGQGGQRGNKSASSRPAPARYMPPRDRNDIICTNCGRKNHTASECRQPKVEMKDRPCFECGKSGHLARNCPDKKPRPQPMKAITDAERDSRDPRRPAAVMAVTIGEPRLGVPRKQPAVLGDFVKSTAARRNTNRYQALDMSNVAFWKEVASAVPKPSEASLINSEHFPELPSVGTSTSLARICSKPLMSHQLGETRASPPTTQGGDAARVVTSGGGDFVSPMRRPDHTYTHTSPSHTSTHTRRSHASTHTRCSHTHIHPHIATRLTHTHQIFHARQNCQCILPESLRTLFFQIALPKIPLPKVQLMHWFHCLCLMIM